MVNKQKTNIAIAFGLGGLLFSLTLIFFQNYSLQVPILIEVRSPIRSRYISPISEDRSNVKVKQLQTAPSDYCPLDEGNQPLGPCQSETTPKPKRSLIPRVEASEIDVDFETLYQRVRILESNKGTAPEGHHRYCEGLGMINEVGYGNRQKLCFESESEQRVTLINWYTKRLNEGMTINEALCYWESGYKNITNCAYAQNYNSL